MFKKLNQALETLFEQESQQNWLIEQGLFESKKNYSVETDYAGIKNLSYIYESGVSSEQLSVFGERLASHFEFVFIFKKQHGQNHYTPASVSLYGKTLPIHLKWDHVRFPHFPLLKVYRTSARGLFKKLRVSDLDKDEQLTAYMIQISPQHLLLVATVLAEPWAQIKLSALQEALMKINFQT